MSTKRQQVQEVLADENPDALFADGFDKAIIGIARRSGLAVVAYSQNKCIHELMEQGMDYDEAQEYFEFNVIGSWMGEHTPVFIED